MDLDRTLNPVALGNHFERPWFRHCHYAESIDGPCRGDRPSARNEVPHISGYCEGIGHVEIGHYVIEEKRHYIGPGGQELINAQAMINATAATNIHFNNCITTEVVRLHPQLLPEWPVVLHNLSESKRPNRPIPEPVEGSCLLTPPPYR